MFLNLTIQNIAEYIFNISLTIVFRILENRIKFKKYITCFEETKIKYINQKELQTHTKSAWLTQSMIQSRLQEGNQNLRMDNTMKWIYPPLMKIKS